MLELRTELLFELNVELGEVLDFGAAPHGNRRLASLKGGTFGGPKLRGEVLPGGSDWALGRPDNAREIDVRLTLRTDDEQLIYTTYRGINTLSPDILGRITRGETVNPSEYYLRISPVFETGSEKYGWLNRIVTVGLGERTRTAVIFTVYSIL